jgi:hypothetical protein
MNRVAIRSPYETAQTISTCPCPMTSMRRRYSAILFDRYNKAHPGNVFERIFLPTSVVPEHGGLAFAWSMRR